MQTVLEPCLTALLLIGRQDITTLQQRMNAEKGDPYFEAIIHKLPSVLQHFFTHGFYDKRYTVSKNSIYTRLQSLLNHELLYIMLTGEETFRFDSILGKGKLIVINVAKGSLGNEVATVLGKFFMESLLGSVFRNSNRFPCYLLVDEMQLLTARSLTELLTEARKKKLFLIGATQSLGHFDEKLKNQLIVNTGIQLVGRTHPKDVQLLTRYRELPKYEISHLKKYQFLFKYEEEAPVTIRTPKRLQHKKLKRSSKDIHRFIQEHIHTSTYYRKRVEKD